MRTTKILILFILSFFILTSCEKFLSERSLSSVSNLNSLEDMQALLDGANVLNYGSYCVLSEIATDDFIVGKGGFDRAVDLQKSIYLWNQVPIMTLGETGSNWRNPFRVVAISNIILEELPLVEHSGSLSRDYIEGAAYFFRAFTYHNLVQVYCEAYDSETAQVDLGLPLKYTADVHDSPDRASLEETYQFIEEDLMRAIKLLPVRTQFQTRPNKIAVHALLARIYLLMGRYEEALQQADYTLNYQDSLIDFSTLDPNLPVPIERFNRETIFYAFGAAPGILNPNRECYIDTNIYRMYGDKDLRKRIYFQEENNGLFRFKGSFAGTSSAVMFNGLTVSETLLIKAETSVRLGRAEESTDAMITLLASRYENEDYRLQESNSSEALLKMILDERRKELILRGTRWSDLKRLNRDPRFARTLYRKIPGTETIVELPPNDPRYVFLLPNTVVEDYGLVQNPR